MDSHRHLEHLALDAARLREAAAADLAAPVPTCPGWTAADLLNHVAEVYLHKVEMMRHDAWPDPWPPEPDEAGPLAYFDRALAELQGEFAARTPGDRTLTWYGPDQTVGFWIRRMAQETVVHRVDGELAAGLLPVTPIPADLAADGIDEVLVAFLAYTSEKWPEEFGSRLAECDGRAVSIRADGERRLVRLQKDAAVEISTDASDGDASVSGNTQDVLLWLWRRRDGSGLDFGGDRELVERLRGLLEVATQ
jgi:uncharacterized protein (TIGR03083 family)